MVKFPEPHLDRTFSALSDPTRRALLARIAAAPESSVSTLAAPFPVSLPAIMKHLDVLSDAGLIERAKQGRTVVCRLRAAPMAAAMNWLRQYERFWSMQLDQLADFLNQEDTEEERWRATSDRASHSPAGSSRRPGGSSAPGRNRTR